MSDYLSSEMEAKEYQPRFRLLYIALSATMVIFSLRLWYLQIVNGRELRQFSEQNSIRETKIPAPRGIVYDRNGEVLIENLPGFEVTLSPQYVSNLEETAEALGLALNIPPSTVMQQVQRSRRINGPFRPVRIKENLTRDDIFNIEVLKQDYTGIDIKETVVRAYPLKENGAQFFGYVAEVSKRRLPILNERFAARGVRLQQGDLIGTSGLEEVFDIELRGRDGISVAQLDAHGREAIGDPMGLLGSMGGITPATPGNNIILTIDKDIQEAAWRAFVEGNRIGGAIAMKANGEILAWVSAPSFDPNNFSTGISPALWRKLINDPDKPLRNKPIQDHNSPGSTFKPLIAIAALAENVITPNTIVACPGALRFGSRLYHDHLRGGHGNLTVSQAIERSSNVFFYKMGIALGIDKMHRYCDALGIGRRTGIELMGERAGLMPSSEWKKGTIGEEWQPGENLSVAIGQGFVLSNPLQMAVSYNAIGTEGKVVKPFVVRRILSPDNQLIKEFEPQVLRDLGDPNGEYHIKSNVFKSVKEGMRLVVSGERGTARASRLPYIEIAGKTGTSQVMGFSADQIYASCEARPKHQRHHGWFIGYAPADNPEIAFGVLAEHACHGSSGAAPVAKAMVAAYVAKYRPEWLERNVHKKPTPAAPKETTPAVDSPIEGE
ncbi:MAG: penicillin-binding protein 2 [Bdellovibrionales bacterium]|jgi:penicillin-binding protein 2|nr:penicillin-binding protein 2 [Bdellovibrionales bacterium]